MSPSIRFLHTADIHLGSSLLNLSDVSGDTGETLRFATYSAFEKLIDIGIENEIDFLLISGDVYDHDVRSIKTEHFLINQFQRLNDKKIPVFMIFGNHDPVGDKRDILKLPENVHVFGSEETSSEEFYVNGQLAARIYGLSPRGRSDSRKMYSSYAVPDTAVWNIGMLHTALNPSDQNYVPCSQSDLEAKKDFHYWALGHVHTWKLLRKKNPVIAYPGTIQGRNPRETGVCGCLLVDLPEDSDPVIQFIQTSSVIWKELEVCIEKGTKPGNIDELEEKIISEADEFIKNTDSRDIVKGYALRWRVTGKSELYNLIKDELEDTSQILTQNLREKLSKRKPFIWTESVKLHITPNIPNLAKLKKDNILFKDIDEIASNFYNDEEAIDKVYNVIGNIWEQSQDPETRDPKKIQIDNDRLLTLIETAKELVIEEIVERRKI